MIDTYEAAVAEMLAWANGKKSHWNSLDSDLIGPYQGLQVEIANAAEVQKWAAVAGVLRDRPHTVVGQPIHCYPDQELPGGTGEEQDDDYDRS